MRVIIVRKDLVISRVSIVTCNYLITRPNAKLQSSRTTAAISEIFFTIQIKKVFIRVQIRPFLYLKFISTKCCNKQILSYFLSGMKKILFYLF